MLDILKTIATAIVALLATMFGTHQAAVAISPPQPTSAQVAAVVQTATITATTPTTTTQQLQDLSSAQNPNQPAQQTSITPSQQAATNAQQSTISKSLGAQHPTNAYLVAALDYATKADLASSTAALNAAFQSQIAVLSTVSPSTLAALQNEISQTNRISQLPANVVVSGVSGLAVGDIPDLSSEYLPVSGGTISGSLTLTNGTSTNFFATTASSTNLFAQSASLGSLTLATSLTASQGGTGVNNGSNTLTLNGDLVTAGPLTLAAPAMVFEGDSITHSNDITSWVDQFLISNNWFDGNANFHDPATNGDNACNMVTEYAAHVHPYAPKVAGTAYAFFFTGGNDILNGASAATTIACIQTLWADARADGFKVIAFTVMNRTTFTGSLATQWAALNADIEADSADYDALVRTDLVLTDPTDSTYFNDGTHPTPAGYKLIAAQVNAVFQQLVTANSGMTWSGLYPRALLTAEGGPNGANTGGDQIREALIEGPNQNPASTATGNLTIQSNDNFAMGYGGSIMFGGRTAGNTNASNFAGIKGYKENGTSGDVAGALGFFTRNGSSGAVVQNATLTSTGQFQLPGSGSGLYLYDRTNSDQWIAYANAGVFNLFAATNTANELSLTESGNLSVVGSVQGSGLGIGVAPSTGALADILGAAGTSGGQLRIRNSTSQGGLTFDTNDGGNPNSRITSIVNGGLFLGVNNASQVEITTTGITFVNSAGTLATPSVTGASTAAQNLAITAGSASGSGTASNGGSIVLTAGTSTNGTAGSIILASNVAVGTSTPYATLEVWGPDTASSSAFLVANSASTTVFSVRDNGNATYSGSIFQSSDQRLKTNVQSLDGSSALTDVDALNPVSYTRLDQPGAGTNFGFLAQQVGSIFPELVSTTSPTELTPDGTLTLNYEGLIAPVVSAIQALSDQINGFADSFTTKQLAFDRAQGVEIDAGNVNAQNQLCVGSTCVTPAQFQAMVAASQITNTQSSSGQGSGTSDAPATSTPDTPPVIQINGDNPATIQVGATYTDLGATIEGPQQDLNLGITTFLNGALESQIVIDTSQVATDTIDYVATDQSGLTSTTTRTVIVSAAAAITATSTTQ